MEQRHFSASHFSAEPILQKNVKQKNALIPGLLPAQFSN
jgi:hypothetical protein